MHGDKDSFVKFGLDPQEAQLKIGLNPKDQDFGEIKSYNLLEGLYYEFQVPE